MSTAGPPIWGRHAEHHLKLDCLHYRGDRPCSVGVQGICPVHCVGYRPMGHRILIIKLAALGDVIRTAALLPGLKAVWPASHITWVSQPSGVRVLANHPLIDRRLVFDAPTVCHLEYERFDLCLSLDKEPGPTALAMRVQATEKRGIGLSPYGTPYPLNEECAHYFHLGLSDPLKFRANDKSYPQLIYEAVGLTYRGERARLYPSAADQARAARRWRALGVGGEAVVVGLNTGAGRVFANKSWSADQFVALARRVREKHGWQIALLGGPEERALNARIAAVCPGVVDTGCDHSELEFAALVARCNVVVTGDTMAMHVASAAEVPCVVLFGPTCHQEIDLCGRGEKIVTELSCAPCYRRACDVTPSCMDSITVERVCAAVKRWVDVAPTRPVALPVVGAGV